jgi:hypothetical protein
VTFIIHPQWPRPHLLKFLKPPQIAPLAGTKHSTHASVEDMLYSNLHRGLPGGGSLEFVFEGVLIGQVEVRLEAVSEMREPSGSIRGQGLPTHGSCSGVPRHAERKRAQWHWEEWQWVQVIEQTPLISVVTSFPSWKSGGN